MKIAIGIAATKGYTIAMRAQARAIAKQADMVPEEIDVFIAGDSSKEVKDIVAYWKGLRPWKSVQLLKLAAGDGGENYKIPAQLLIAKLREAIFAQCFDHDYLWMLDSDVLPKSNSLRSMLDMLRFDGGYYSIAFCPYPSQGGGSFLGGFGDSRNPIYADFLEEERELSDEAKKAKEKMDKFAKALGEIKTQEQHDKLVKKAEELKLKELIEQCPPKGNIFQLQACGWRKRGWFDFAYPALGKGAVVPVDWIGFGNTLMGKAAIQKADFTGYDGRGTEDLFIIYRRWQGLKICCIPHCPADHVIRTEKGPTLIRTWHEEDIRFEGHLRRDATPFVDLL